MTGIRIGAIVTHQAWGIGKVLFLTDSKAVVGFPSCRTDGDPGVREVSLRGTYIELAHNAADPAPDNWNLTLDSNGRVLGPKTRAGRAKALKPVAVGAALSADQAVARFRERYPGAFADERYLALERALTWEKHLEWHERIGTHSLVELAQANLRQLAHDTMRVVQTKRKSLLDKKTEIPAFLAGLALDGPSRSYFAAVDGLLAGAPDDRPAFARLCEATVELMSAAGAPRVHAWPVVTIVPHLARPDHFMLVKPLLTRRGVERLGHDWTCKAEPNADTYASLMDLSRTLLEALRPHGARDFIDVQSFLWVVGE